MGYEIEILNDVAVDKTILAALKLAVATGLRHLSINHAELSLLLTNDNRLQQLNRDFRQVDKSTDVLSFPSMDPVPVFNELELYLGDIAISVPYANTQANLNGHSLIAELQLLAVHGLLHLLGYDHLEPMEKEDMWSLQEQILAKLGLYDIRPTED